METVKGLVRFYHTIDMYHELSNYHVAPFIDAYGHVWQTVEHYYQAQKFHHVPSYYHLIRFADSPAKAYLLGNLDASNQLLGSQPVYEGSLYSVTQEVMRHAHFRVREDWDLVKISVMYDGMVFKFTQNPQLMWKLLSTKQHTLEQGSPIHDFWGLGADGNGANWTGYLLEMLRQNAQKETRNEMRKARSTQRMKL